jgi:hypothetical protein
LVSKSQTDVPLFDAKRNKIMTLLNQNRLYIPDLDGPFLDYLVAEAVGLTPRLDSDRENCYIGIPSDKPTSWVKYSPSKKWSSCGPLITFFGLSVEFEGTIEGMELYVAYMGYERPKNNMTAEYGSTPLLAISRAVAKMQFGDVIDIGKKNFDIFEVYDEARS